MSKKTKAEISCKKPIPWESKWVKYYAAFVRGFLTKPAVYFNIFLKKNLILYMLVSPLFFPFTNYWL